MHLFGTIFSREFGTVVSIYSPTGMTCMSMWDRLAHVYFNGRALSPSLTAWLTDEFLIVFGQQYRSMAQTHKLHQAIQTILYRINSCVSFGPFMRFVQCKKNKETLSSSNP